MRHHLLPKHWVWSVAGLLWAASPAPGIAQTVPVPPLVEAVKAGQLAKARDLVRGGAPVNRSEPDGKTALHWAVLANDMAAAELLIEAGADVRLGDRYGVTPLSLAATNGSTPMIERLLKAGADPNAANAEGETVLMTAAKTGVVAAIRLLVDHGAAVNTVEPWQEQTALMWAAGENHAEAVTALLQVGADPDMHSKPLNYPVFYKGSMSQNEVYPNGAMTALMYASRDGRHDAVRALAEGGANLDLTAGDGATAVTLAIINGHFATAIMLLEHGADPNVVDVAGMGPLYAAVDMHTLATGGAAFAPKLDEAVDAVEVVETLLARGADPNRQLTRPVTGRHRSVFGDTSLGRGATPLARAARSNDLVLVRLLLAAGAKPDLALQNGLTPLIIAAAGAHTMGYYGTVTNSDSTTIEIFMLLIERGADVNAFDANGQTAVHWAAMRWAPAIIEFLVEHGAVAALEQRNRQGRTPLELAATPGGIPDARLTGILGIVARRPDAVMQQRTVALLRELMERHGVPVPPPANVTPAPANVTRQ